jgi:hypothetical protein
LRLSTAATRRAIDKWEERTRSEASRFYASCAAILASFLSDHGRLRVLFGIALVLATMFNFAFSEFALLALLGFLTVKLHCYRLVNSFLNFLPFPR